MVGVNSVLSKVLDCDIVETDFQLHSEFDVHLWSNTLWNGMNYRLLPRCKIVPLLSFYKDSLSIKLPTNIIVPLK